MLGRIYLVMEFIDGKSLKGPLPLEQALAIAIQLADPSDAAHKRAITRRDLKPANAMLTKSEGNVSSPSTRGRLSFR
jgi:serine/threonine protein kinase